MSFNNNLVTIPPNLLELPGILQANSTNRDNTVYYVHLEHITGETSHYFIICQMQTQIILLQSAVFEYSIADWLFPDQAEADEVKSCDEQIAALDPTDELRFNIYKQQIDYTLRERLHTLQRIRECTWSCGRPSSITDFCAQFIPALTSLEGHWALDTVERRSATYTQLFACFLKPGPLRGKLRQTLAPAHIKFVSAPMTVSLSPSDSYTRPAYFSPLSREIVPDNTGQKSHDNASVPPPPVD